MRRGQALAEFALVAPIFFLVMGAIIQGSVYFWSQNTSHGLSRFVPDNLSQRLSTK